nr:hypothetical protein [Tanacetum cinerariifolium]
MTLVQPMVSHIDGLNIRNSTSLDTVPSQIIGADYNEYKIPKADFKNLHPNNFKDMYLLNLQGQLNHLSGANKVHLFNVVNLRIRNIVIRKRVEDLRSGLKVIKRNSISLNRIGMHLIFYSKKTTP